MTLDEAQIPWREASRRADEEADRIAEEEWRQREAEESVEAVTAYWERVMRQQAAEMPEEVHYLERGWIEPACRGPHD
jgi:hypothetical protein